MEEILYKLVGYYNKDFLFNITSRNISLKKSKSVFQRYRMNDSEMKEIKFIQEKDIDYISSKVSKVIPSLPYYPLTYKSFIDIKENLNEITFENHPYI